jgi:hypothetical protein
MGFEPMIPASERGMTVHALDRHLNDYKYTFEDIINKINKMIGMISDKV